MIGDFAQFGEVLRNARVAKRVSQAELALGLGVTQTTISRAEAGRDMKLGTLVQIARALDLEPLLVPRALVPAIRTMLRSRASGQHSMYSANSDALYNEAVDNSSEAINTDRQ
jgi:HTH-type transcriptional regulator / antitoxin HipB